MEKEVARRFGLNLLLARREARMSQDDLAKQAFMDRAALSRIENGHRLPRLDHMVRVAEVLEVQIRDLLHGIG
jgi:transcriptional regulator with XRE-family HTH domain